MLDRRQSVRDKVIFGGVAEINERGSTMDCVVRNISEGGACVEFDETAKLPDEMNLTIARKGRSFFARMIWRQADRVGLAFRTMTASGVPALPISTSGCAAANGKSVSFSAASRSCWAKAEQSRLTTRAKKRPAIAAGRFR